MNNYYNIDIIIKENVYRKVWRSYKSEYSDFELKRKLLEDLIRLTRQYPEAYIVVSNDRAILHNISYSKSTKNGLTFEEIQSMKNYTRYKISNAPVDYSFHIENHPWTIKIINDDLKVLQISYVFNSDYAKKFAIKQSKERPNGLVMVENYGAIRMVLKHGETETDNPIPPKWALMDIYSKKRWYSF